MPGVIQLEQCPACKQYVDERTMLLCPQHRVEAPGEAGPADVGAVPGSGVAVPPQPGAAQRIAQKVGARNVAHGVKVRDVAEIGQTIAEGLSSVPGLPPRAQVVVVGAAKVLAAARKLFGK